MNIPDFNDLLKTLVQSGDLGMPNRKHRISEDSFEDFLINELGYQVVDPNSKLITKSEINHALWAVNEFIKNNNKK